MKKKKLCMSASTDRTREERTREERANKRNSMKLKTETNGVYVSWRERLCVLRTAVTARVKRSTTLSTRLKYTRSNKEYHAKIKCT